MSECVFKIFLHSSLHLPVLQKFHGCVLEESAKGETLILHHINPQHCWQEMSVGPRQIQTCGQFGWPSTKRCCVAVRGWGLRRDSLYNIMPTAAVWMCLEHLKRLHTYSTNSCCCAIASRSLWSEKTFESVVHADAYSREVTDTYVRKHCKICFWGTCWHLPCVTRIIL